jgi:hypothetical protein
VKNQVLLETLKPEDDYLRGYLTQFTEEYRRKMKIHYPNVDVESRKQKFLAALKGNPSEFDEVYRQAKVDALSDFIRDDTDAYLSLYKNNSYISSYDDGDTFGYDIPADMEAKLEGLMKLDWDKDSSSPDVTPYVQMISQLTECATPLFAKMNPKLASSIQKCIKSAMTDSTDEVLRTTAVLQTASASLCGDVPANINDSIKAVLSALKPAGALKAEDAGAVVATFRGIASSVEANTLKGKSDDDLCAQFKDVPEDRLAALVQCANAANGVNDKNVAALLVSGLFANCPTIFTQFAMDSNNLKTFISSNGGAFESVATAVAALNPQSEGVAKNMDAAAAGVQKWLQTTLSLDKAGLDAVAAELPAMMASCGKQTTPWMARAASEAAKNATGLDLVEANTLAQVFSNPAVENTTGMKFYSSVFGGGCVKSVAAACAEGTFAEDFGTKLASSLLSSGKATPAQAEAVESKIGTVAEVKTLVSESAKAMGAFNAVDDAYSL